MCKIFSIIFLSGAASCFLGVPALAADEWVVEQKENTFYLSQTAVRAVNHENNFEMVAKAPDWKCYGYRTDKKIIWETPMESFNSLVFIRPFMDGVTLRTPPIRVGKSTVSGFKCTEYKTLGGFLYGSEEIKIAPKAIEFVNRYLFTSTIKEVPLFYKQKSDTSKYEVKPWFDKGRYQINAGRTSIITISIKKKSYAAKDFAIPVGYKRTNRAKDIAYSEAKKRQFEDVIEGVGFMSSDKEQNKH